MRAAELGTSKVLMVPSLMNHENYSYELEEWLNGEAELAKLPYRYKPFIGDRPYRHFDGRVPLRDTQTNKAEYLLNELRYPARLAKHAFFPFVRKDNKVRRFTKVTSLNAENRVVKSVAIKQKIRPIMYASHRDATIYGFYGHMLKKAYDLRVKSLGIDENVIAYRKVPRNDGSGRNKSNIDFANDIYKELGMHKKSAIICLDISDFFGSMIHENIEVTWKQLLEVKDLPLGHKTVFRNITRYRYLFLDDAKVALKLGSIVNGKFIYKKDLPQSRRAGPLSSDSKEYNQLIKQSKLVKINGSPRGIPQGSPISDILANMYLMNFDKSINDIVVTFDFGISRRYSDDILIICPQDKVMEVYSQVGKLMDADGLRINTSKSELFFLDRDSRTLVDMTKLLVEGYAKNKSSIQYLGFEFDLDDIHIRSGTIANHYRKIKRSIKKDEITSKDDERDEEKTAVKRKSIKKDKYAYIKKASSRIGGARLIHQFSSVRKRTSRLRRESKVRKSEDM